ncbi:peptidase C2, calpain family [Kipferlia bialata]|uniref:Peptidase C2, calpain family n=1 Tax=Kipferlia bialata TaxID=797122 RepID=A0A9K3GGF1_9EUKA|nr:peptidase C2, calpain family [Kipferlia bialata]|eukprot:g2721.t1
MPLIQDNLPELGSDSEPSAEDVSEIKRELKEERRLEKERQRQESKDAKEATRVARRQARCMRRELRKRGKYQRISDEQRAEVISEYCNGASQASISRNLDIKPSTVKSIVQTYRKGNGRVHKKKRGGKRYAKVTEEIRALLFTTLSNDSSLTLKSLVDIVQEETGVTLSLSAVRNAVLKHPSRGEGEDSEYSVKSEGIEGEVHVKTEGEGHSRGSSRSRDRGSSHSKREMVLEDVLRDRDLGSLPLKVTSSEYGGFSGVYTGEVGHYQPSDGDTEMTSTTQSTVGSFYNQYSCDTDCTSFYGSSLHLSMSMSAPHRGHTRTASITDQTDERERVQREREALERARERDREPPSTSLHTVPPHSLSPADPYSAMSPTPGPGSVSPSLSPDTIKEMQGLGEGSFGGIVQPMPPLYPDHAPSPPPHPPVAPFEQVITHANAHQVSGFRRTHVRSHSHTDASLPDPIEGEGVPEERRSLGSMSDAVSTDSDRRGTISCWSREMERTQAARGTLPIPRPSSICLGYTGATRPASQAAYEGDVSMLTAANPFRYDDIGSVREEPAQPSRLTVAIPPLTVRVDEGTRQTTCGLPPTRSFHIQQRVAADPDPPAAAQGEGVPPLPTVPLILHTQGQGQGGREREREGQGQGASLVGHDRDQPTQPETWAGTGYATYGDAPDMYAGPSPVLGENPFQYHGPIVPDSQGTVDEAMCGVGIMSAFADVPSSPPDPILNLGVEFKADPSPLKINLGIGAYRTAEGQPWILPCVAAAEERILAGGLKYNKEYPPIQGHAEYTRAAQEIMFGEESPALAEGRIATLQSISGTGALHIAFCFAKQFLTREDGTPRPMYYPNVTWPNHHPIYAKSYCTGQAVRTYTYIKKGTLEIDIEGMLKDIAAADEGSVFLFHPSAHNPTGCDPTPVPFPPSPSSLVPDHCAEGEDEDVTSLRDRQVSRTMWRRASEINWGAPATLVTDGITSCDVEQGCLGDCGFMCALSAICAYESVVRHVLVDYDPDMGRATIQLYHQGAWCPIVIDDHLPCLNDPTLQRHGLPSFARSTQKGELWPSFIEKAYAKLRGSYAALVGCSTLDALVALTGGVGFRMNLSTEKSKSKEGGEGEGGAVLPLSNGETDREISAQVSDTGDRERDKTLALWAKMQEVVTERSGCMCCSADKDNDHCIDHGIIPKHGYSVLEAVEVERPSMDPVLMVLCRNPHATTAYSGPFCACDTESWDTIPAETRTQMLQRLQDDPGCCWMPVPTLVSLFSYMSFCYVESQFKHTSRHDGAWCGNSATGVFSTSPTAMHAPMYELRVGASEEERHIVLAVAQGPTHDSPLPRPMGMHVMRYPDGTQRLEGVGSRVLSHHTPHEHCSSATWATSRDQILDIVLEGGPETRLCVVPSLHKRGAEGPFCIRTLSNTPQLLLAAAPYERHAGADVPLVYKPRYTRTTRVCQEISLTTNTPYILVPSTHGVGQTSDYVLTVTAPTGLLAPEGDPVGHMTLGTAATWSDCTNMATTELQSSDPIRLRIEGAARKLAIKNYGSCQISPDLPAGEYGVTLEAERGVLATLAVRASGEVAFPTPTKYLYGSSVDGQWTNQDHSATGVFSTSPTAMHAPMYELRVGASEEERHIVLTLAQEDKRSENVPLVALGMHVMTYPEGTPRAEGVGSRVPAYQPANLHTKSDAWSNPREQVLDVNLEAGPEIRLCVIPSLHKRGEERHFCLQSHSDTCHSLLEAPSYDSYYTCVSTNDSWLPGSNVPPTSPEGPARDSFASCPQHTFMIESSVDREISVDIALYQTEDVSNQNAMGFYVMKANPEYPTDRLYSLQQRYDGIDVPVVLRSTYRQACCNTQSISLTTNTPYILVPSTHGVGETSDYVMSVRVPTICLAEVDTPAKMSIGTASEWHTSQMGGGVSGQRKLLLAESGVTEFGIACHTSTGPDPVKLLIEGPTHRFRVSHFGYCQQCVDVPSGEYTITLEAEASVKATLAVRARGGVVFK